MATATVAAHGDDTCRDEGCFSLAWPNYADRVSTQSDVDALLENGELVAAEADIVTALVVRRQALRIRGLELRYLVGKTATSEGEGTNKLDHIRHQVDSIEEEISYIDRELAQLLHDYGSRSGPWLVMLTNDACTQYWFVARSPCNGQQHVVLPSAVKPHWLETDAHIDPVSDVGLPDACTPLSLGLHCPSPGSGEPLVLRIDGTIRHFYRGD